MSWIRKSAAVAALVCMLAGAAMTANAQRGRVQFEYRGGRWSHSRHSGWHRYWGGPSIGFYYAPEPVYIVRGYEDPYYYEGPDFWYSNPSFGLSFNYSSGGGYYDRDHRYHTYRRERYDRDRYDHDRYRGDRDSRWRDRDDLRDRWR